MGPGAGRGRFQPPPQSNVLEREMQSQAGNGIGPGGPNRDSGDYKEQGRRMAEEVFSNSAFTSPEPQVELFGVGIHLSCTSVAKLLIQNPSGPAPPVRGGVKTGMLIPTTMDYQSSNLGTNGDGDGGDMGRNPAVMGGVGMGNVQPAIQEFSEHYVPQMNQQGPAGGPAMRLFDEYGNQQDHPRRMMSADDYPLQQQQQRRGDGGPPAPRRFASADDANQRDDDRFKGYPPPGQLIPEHERQYRPSLDEHNSGNRTNMLMPPVSDGTPLPSVDDLTAVIFSGELLKQNRRGKFQKRLFRFDGLLLICLSPKRHKLPDHINLLTFDPARHTQGSRSNEFISALGRFYPTNPPMPALTNPLIASWNENGGRDGNPDIYTKYYHMPKWIIPTAAMLSVKASQGANPRDPESKLSRTFTIETHGRDYVLRAPSASEFKRWTFLLSRMSAIGGDGAVTPPRNINQAAYPQQPENDDEDNDDANNSDDEEGGMVVVNNGFPEAPYQPVNPVMNPSHPSIARMGAWQRSVTDLLARDEGASDNVLSIGNSDGTGTISERGLSKRMSRVASMTSNGSWNHPSSTPPVPMLAHGRGSPGMNGDRSGSPQQMMQSGGRVNQPSPLSNQSRAYGAERSTTPPGARGESPQGFRPGYGAQGGLPGSGNGQQQRAYPMPVPLRPEQLQPPDGRVMKGPTIFGAAIAAGIHPTTPLMPGTQNGQPGGERGGGGGAPPRQMGQTDRGLSVPGGMGRSPLASQTNRSMNRLSVLSSNGNVVPGGMATRQPFQQPTRTESLKNNQQHGAGSPNASSPFGGMDQERLRLSLNPAAMADLQRSLDSLLRVLRRLQGDDGDENSPDPETRRPPGTSPVGSGGRRVRPSGAF
ncbi:hypothetical protein HK101_008134, partial [Irineochytrium annulatum]